mmetsp:Transcript_122696/g.381990  ORF Transcript_122696/g.381990 Transcript_122696/m.381990 type:complete len:254 (-) Transcript_122696:141-902(-)
MLFSRISDSFSGHKCGRISGHLNTVHHRHANKFYHYLLNLPLLRFLPDLLSRQRLLLPLRLRARGGLFRVRTASRRASTWSLLVQCFDVRGPVRPALPTVGQHARAFAIAPYYPTVSASSSCTPRMAMPSATTSSVSATTRCLRRSAWMRRAYRLLRLRLYSPTTQATSDAAVAADLPLQSRAVVRVAFGPDAATIVEMNDNKRWWVSATTTSLLHSHGPHGVRFSDVYKHFNEACGDLSDEVKREIRLIIDK